MVKENLISTSAQCALAVAKNGLGFGKNPNGESSCKK